MPEKVWVQYTHYACTHCGEALHFDEVRVREPNLPQWVLGECWRSQCDLYEVKLKIPLLYLEVELA